MKKIPPSHLNPSPGDKPITFRVLTRGFGVGPTASGGAAASNGGIIKVTVQNHSTYDCIEGTVLLESSSTGEVVRTNFGKIDAGYQVTNSVPVTFLPDTTHWSFKSSAGWYWGPADGSYPGGMDTVILPLT